MKMYARDVDWINMITWLHNHVGQVNNEPLGDMVITGTGWRADRLVNLSIPTTKDIPVSSSWRVEITDDKKGTMFALRWGS